jgi:hypothetical protein
MIEKKTDELIGIDFSHRTGISTLRTFLGQIDSRISFAMASMAVAVALIAVAAEVCSAQTVTSAHSGTLHYYEGDVSIDGTPVQSKAGRFSEVKEQSVLRTAQGRAELLLTPGVFLRVGENSAIKMLDNRLVSTRVEILSGTVIVESDDPKMSIKDSPVTLIYKDFAIQPVKHGLAEISSDPSQMRVYRGEAVVEFANGAANDGATVREGRLLPLSATLLAEKFDDKVGDDLFLWARDRSQSLSAANMSSALSLNSGGSGYGNGYAGGTGAGPGNWTGGWYFNPGFNTYTFVPSGGTSWSPWGYGFFSPATISSYYSPSNYWYGGGGARGTGSIGQPLSGVGNRAGAQATPFSSLRSANSALGSPVGGGTAMGGGRTGFAGGGHAAGGGRGR